MINTFLITSGVVFCSIRVVPVYDYDQGLTRVANVADWIWFGLGRFGNLSLDLVWFGRIGRPQFGFGFFSQPVFGNTDNNLYTNKYSCYMAGSFIADAKHACRIKY